MELEDDFLILDREKCESPCRKIKEIPVSSFSGDESVASHFALVTAYEDIKTRLKETEKENSFLKKRIRLLEDQLIGKCLEDGSNSIGREQVNKAYHAYREICIERDNLKNKLDKVLKDNADSLKVLNEQLQTQEIELLQLKTELETQQVIKNLNRAPNDREVDELNRKMKVCGLEQELELMRTEYLNLRLKMQNANQKEQIPGNDFLRDEATERIMQQALRELRMEVSNLQLVTQVQAELLKQRRATIAATKKASPSTPVQCQEDLVTDHSKLAMTSAGAVYKKQTYFLPPEDADVHRAANNQHNLYAGRPSARTEERPVPIGGPPFRDHDSYGKNSFDDGSWDFSGSPKPSESPLWETKCSPSPTMIAYNFEKHHQS